MKPFNSQLNEGFVPQNILLEVELTENFEFTIPEDRARRHSSILDHDITSN
ncbi:MAG: hypothetical protein AAGA60_02335 [Cyanobacteria bacterium P01_E01_bin.42]